MPTAAEMAHSRTAPQVPSAPTENPRDAIRKPGLHRAITNPSHQRSDFSRCRSSTKASAIWAPPFTPGKRCLARMGSACLYASCRRDCSATFRARVAAGRAARRHEPPGQRTRPAPGLFGHLANTYNAKVRGAQITVRWDCGGIGYVPYGERWECRMCHRRWNTGQIPAEEYWGIMRDMRRMRVSAIVTALAVDRKSV